MFFALIFPVILILLFGAIFSGGSSGPIVVHLQDKDGSQVSWGFITALNSTKTLRVVLVAQSENFSQYLLSNSVSDGIVIPSGFGPNFIQNKPVNVTIYGNPTSQSSQIVSGITSEVVNAFNLRRAGGSTVIGIHQLTVKSESAKYIDFLVPGLIGFSVLTSPMFALVNISSQYKRDKIFKELSLTPLTKNEWLISKILWYILITLISFVLMVLVGVFVFGAHIALSIWLFPFLLMGPFLFVSLGMLVGTVSTSVESAAVVGNLITFPMMFLSGTFFPVNTMPTYLQSIAHALPLYYMIDGLNNVMIYGSYTSALADLGVLVIVGAIFFAFAVRFFKWRED